MAPQERRTIQIITHGPSCFDGAAAAATVARFHEGDRVSVTFAANHESDATIQRLKPASERGPDEVWITDLSWNLIATGEHLSRLARGGTRVYWIDHHRSAISRAHHSEFNVPFAGKLLSEDFSAARLAFNFLKRKRLPASVKRRAFDEFYPIVERADDHDRWVHRIPDSPLWALAVQTLGGTESYREFMRMRTPVMSRKLVRALEAGQRAMRQSLEMARSTIVDRPLTNGLLLRAACCVGYSSEVAAELYQDQHQAVIALFDMRSQGVSLRRSADCRVDLSEIARSLGGGGHAAAAGFGLEELKRAPAEKLVERLSAALSEANPNIANDKQ
jgi:oligoribonuclease NrnB/cAMP/cGMP phosphodiesterase (DHH superfamily)